MRSTQFENVDCCLGWDGGGVRLAGFCRRGGVEERRFLGALSRLLTGVRSRRRLRGDGDRGFRRSCGRGGVGLRSTYRDRTFETGFMPSEYNLLFRRFETVYVCSFAFSGVGWILSAF